MRTKASLLIITLHLILQGLLQADDWPQWRGRNRDNISTDSDLLKSWPENGPPLSWRVRGLGQGISTVSVSGGRVFTLRAYPKSDLTS